MKLLGGVILAAAIGTPVKALAPFSTVTLPDVAIEACSAAGIDRRRAAQRDRRLS